MVYHFTKNIGIDVEADSLEQAMEFASDLDNYDDEVEDTVAEILEDSDFVDGIDGFDVHSGYTEYSGYTDTSAEECDCNKSEEDFYNHLIDKSADGQEIDIEKLVSAVVGNVIATLLGL